jgi:hypothetical protein
MSKLMKDLEEDCKQSVAMEVRELYFRAKGSYDDDCTIIKWYEKFLTNKTTSHTPLISTGSATDFYDINGCKDIDDIAEYWNLKGDEFNCLKAIAGIALGARHSGTSPIRDANKLLHYAKRIVNRLNKDKNEVDR